MRRPPTGATFSAAPFRLTAEEADLRPYVPTLSVTGDCHGCGVCVPVCEAKAITMRSRGEDDADGAAAAQIDPALCNMCRRCLDVCPVEAIREEYPPPWRDVPEG